MLGLHLEDLTSNTRGFEVLEEAISPGSSWKSLKIRGIFQRADSKNHNGRVYPYDVLVRALGEAKESLDSKNMFGELDHPADGNPTVSLKNVSHVISALNFSGKDLLGEAIVFDDPGPAGTPSGRLLGALIRNNCTVGISSRGLGALSKGYSTGDVVNEYKLITFDCVHDPSTQKAYVQAVNESKNYGRSIQDAIAQNREAEQFKEHIREILLRNK
jgi:hypothetical protein